MEKNCVITGDQARLLIQIMTNPNVVYKGEALPDVYLVFGQLIAISNVQPATARTESSS